MAITFSALCIINYSVVIMGAMASQITSVSFVYSTICSDSLQRKHQSSASLAFVRGIHVIMCSRFYAEVEPNTLAQINAGQGWRILDVMCSNAGKVLHILWNVKHLSMLIENYIVWFEHTDFHILLTILLPTPGIAILLGTFLPEAPRRHTKSA